MTCTPKPDKPSSARTRRMAPPKVASISSIRFVVTSGTVASSGSPGDVAPGGGVVGRDKRGRGLGARVGGELLERAAGEHGVGAERGQALLGDARARVGRVADDEQRAVVRAPQQDR